MRRIALIVVGAAVAAMVMTQADAAPVPDQKPEYIETNIITKQEKEKTTTKKKHQNNRKQ